MSRIVADHVNLRGMSVLRNTTLDVQDKRWAARYNSGVLIKLTRFGAVFSFLFLQDKQMQDAPQCNRAETQNTSGYIKRGNADLRESLQCCVHTHTC